MELYLGIDIGTTGVRTAVIDRQKSVLSSCRQPMEEPETEEGRPVQDAELWWHAVESCLDKQAGEIERLGFALSHIEALSVDGTSGTLLLADADLRPVTQGLMYNSAGFDSEAAEIAKAAPSDSIALGASSALARLLFAQKLPGAATAVYAMHQADWIAARLTGRGGHSDETNVLKLGFDLIAGTWPDWFRSAGVRLDLLPRVLPVGKTVGRVGALAIRRFGFHPDTRVVAGTTDSNAAFLASGANEFGEGASSIGTTLAIKLVSDRPVTSPAHGVYSHRLFGRWMAGGGSNSGGGALLAFFDRAELERLQPRLRPDVDTGLDYYPLPGPGERFPVADPGIQPRVSPRPADDAVFLQGLLEGIARIEKQAYDALESLGAPPVRSIRTTGGGSRNDAWTRIRRRILGCPVSSSRADASYGSALVALAAVESNSADPT